MTISSALLEDIKLRRLNFASKMDDNSIAVFFSAPEATRSNDTHYIYRQNSDFWYLTGYFEPESVFIIIKSQNNFFKTILFNRVKDKTAEIWDGFCFGQELAKQTFKLDECYAINELNELLPTLINGKSTLYHENLQYAYADEIINVALKKLSQGRQGIYNLPENYYDYRKIVHSMRLIKSEFEINLLRKSCEITAKAHVRAMQNCKPNQFEYQLEAELMHEFIKNGAKNAAYNNIIAGGKNACILHYETNNELLNDGDLVLIDAGCEYDYYAGDITRTFPINGKFTSAQKEIYNIVLEAQKMAISLLIPDATIKAVNDKVVEFFVTKLIEINLLKGDIKTLIANSAYREFYMHGLGHWLGIDVHDVGSYEDELGDIKLKPGMVLTVEPGLYINTALKESHKYNGIGVRIEDDILITNTGNEILTKLAPKEINEIEALMT